ncbi:MAG: CATRA conflict system CASPASE/TPR repeat-associated protein [Pseudonocardia sp.]
MPGRPELHGCEFVAHLFVAADGPHRGADYRYLRDLWHRCCDGFDVTDDIPGHDRDPPEDPAMPPGPGGVLAVRRSVGPGKHQAVLRLLHDVFCLAVLRAPAPGVGRGVAGAGRGVDHCHRVAAGRGRRPGGSCRRAECVDVEPGPIRS